MASPRRSLRDRNKAAIAHEAEETPAIVAQEPVQEPVSAALAPEPAAVDVTSWTEDERAAFHEQQLAHELHVAEVEQRMRASDRATAKVLRERGSVTERIGIYLSKDEFDDAKAGYLADWTNGGDADTFARWIAAAMDEHSNRTAEERKNDDRLRGRAEERAGSTRSFNIPSSTVTRMRAAIAADQQAGRWPSVSAWCAEAIALAVDEARQRNGGRLPTPPDRLPNKLVR